MNLTLFEIAQEYRRVTDVLMDAGCDQQTLEDTLSGEAWPLELKAQNYGFVIRNLESTVAAIKEAEAQMAARRSALEKRVNFMTERLKLGMQIAGVRELSCPHFAIKLQNNPASVEIFEPALIPADYMRTPEPKPPVSAPDKKLIAQAIKDGYEVQGAKLVTTQRLVIK